MAFRVGQKVVCVDDSRGTKYMPAGFGPSRSSNLHGLTRGRVYTIRDLDTEEGILVCRVEEIIRPVESYYGKEAWFAQGRFRPVAEKKTDIGFAHEILRKASKRETQPA